MSNDFFTKHAAKKMAAKVAASVDGKHYSDYVDVVKKFKQEGALDDAVALLLRLIGATESESAIMGLGVAPWYYEQLAIIYRKKGLSFDEKSILERYMVQQGIKSTNTDRLAIRLKKLKSA